eukprot:TRINITY_DN4742_c0_g1_i1.p1 TRINITY_DN4742_c0_g1~~TRINITY_DN4742_c0_g1_i1.p1  ORF type:complete len:578 (+),score=225.47 TRINITY_DN4742_c0_g1_i1:32-1765(+)
MTTIADEFERDLREDEDEVNLGEDEHELDQDSLDRKLNPNSHSGSISSIFGGSRSVLSGNASTGSASMIKKALDSKFKSKKKKGIALKDEMDTDSEEEDNRDEENLESMLKYSDVEMVSQLRRSDKIANMLGQIETYSSSASITSAALAVTGSSELVQPLSPEDPEYRLLVDCNASLVDIGTEISKVHKFVRDHYSKKYPELEKFVINPSEYVRVVKAIGNSDDLKQVNLQDVLQSATFFMVLTMTPEPTPLSEEDLERINKGCDELVELEVLRLKILTFVEARMSKMAPNMTVIVGPTITAQLIGAAGGLLPLSRLPATIIQMLGTKKAISAGFGAAHGPVKHTGYIGECDLVLRTPHNLRRKFVRSLANKLLLAARVDTYQSGGGDAEGRDLRSQVERKLEKLQEPPPPKLEKPLPIPDDKNKRKKRGGRRFRKEKEKYGMTDLRKFQNRVAFGVQEETFGNSERGLGMIGNTGKIKIEVKKTQFKRKNNPFLQKANGTSTVGGGLSTMSGATSLVFTPVQGLELGNPHAEAIRNESHQRYFGNASFSKVSAPPKSEKSSADDAKFIAPAPKSTK